MNMLLLNNPTFNNINQFIDPILTFSFNLIDILRSQSTLNVLLHFTYAAFLMIYIIYNLSILMNY